MGTGSSRYLRVALGAIALSLAVPLAVLGGGQSFADVPPSHQFFTSIEAVKAANVTSGCGDGTNYCPNGLVTRGQMAAFMNRLGALSAGSNPVVNADRVDGLDSSAFARPMYAVVSAAGSLVRGAATTGIVKQSTGTYRIEFNRSVATCAFTATLASTAGGFPPAGGFVGVAFSDTASPNDIYVETRNTAAALADLPFQVHVTCVAAEGAVTGTGPDEAPNGNNLGN